MLSIIRIVCLTLIPTVVLDPLGRRISAAEAGVLHVEVHVVGRKYCTGDSELFTVSSHLDIDVVNISKAPVYLPSTMTPWLAKVAANKAEAEMGPTYMR